LEDAGDERFARKAEELLQELMSIGPGQTLYQAVMKALGYARNKAPFLELSRRVPLAALECSGGRSDGFRRETEALLLNASGLAAADAKACSDDSESMRQATGILSMNAGQWEARARPGNSPRARIKAMSGLLERYHPAGLLRGLLDEVMKAVPQREGIVSIEEALMVGPDEASESRADGKAAGLLGRGRAGEIAVNVLLPFAHAYGRSSSDSEMMGKAVALFCVWPRLESNCVERHMMAQTGLTRAEVKSARHQQGLMAVYATLCIRGRCGACPLGKPQSG